MTKSAMTPELERILAADFEEYFRLNPDHYHQFYNPGGSEGRPGA